MCRHECYAEVKSASTGSIRFEQNSVMHRGLNQRWRNFGSLVETGLAASKMTSNAERMHTSLSSPPHTFLNPTIPNIYAPLCSTMPQSSHALSDHRCTEGLAVAVWTALESCNAKLKLFSGHCENKHDSDWFSMMIPEYLHLSARFHPHDASRQAAHSHRSNDCNIVVLGHTADGIAAWCIDEVCREHSPVIVASQENYRRLMKIACFLATLQVAIWIKKFWTLRKYQVKQVQR